MPNTTTYTDVVVDWEKLLAGVEDHDEQLGEATQEERDELQQILGEAKVAKARQDSHTAARQQATQELQQILERGRDVAMKMRSAIKAKVGLRNEILVQFGIAPLRRRVRKPVVAPFPPPPPTPEAPAPVEGE